MAVCVGCGLHVNAGILEVQLCGDGGIKCATAAAPSPSGCKDGLYVIPVTAGCGVVVDATTGKVGIHTQGQTDNTPTALATAQKACPSPNCNGLVCTDQGLWAPPKLFGNAYHALDQDITIAGQQMDTYLQNTGPIADVLSLPDGFPANPPKNDFVAYSGNYQELFHSTGGPQPACDLVYFGNTFSTYTISYAIKAGEMWRWLLWERGCPSAGPGYQPATGSLATALCPGTNWALQASFYNDRRGQAASVETVQMNDVSTHQEVGLDVGSKAEWEFMITGVRLVGTGPLDNNIVFASRQYRKTTASAHCKLNSRDSAAAAGATPFGPP